MDYCPAEVADEEGEHRESLAEENEEETSSALGCSLVELWEEDVDKNGDWKKTECQGESEESVGIRCGVLEKIEFLSDVLDDDFLVVDVVFVCYFIAVFLCLLC